jgi:hypothetical protein
MQIPQSNIMSKRLTISNPEALERGFRARYGGNWWTTIHEEKDKYVWESPTGRNRIILHRNPTPNGYYKLEITAPHINWSGFINLPDKLTVLQSEVFGVLNLKDV